MGSQRTYATIKERISYTFMNNSVTPDKSYNFFRSLYPIGQDVVIPIEVITGMINFIKEEIDMNEIEYEDIGIIDVSLSDNLFKLSYAIVLGNFEVRVYNYKYTHTATIDIYKDGKITTVNDKNYKDNQYFINKCADTLAVILSAVYNRRWNDGKC